MITPTTYKWLYEMDEVCDEIKDFILTLCNYRGQEEFSAADVLENIEDCTRKLSTATRTLRELIKIEGI